MTIIIKHSFAGERATVIDPLGAAKNVMAQRRPSDQQINRVLGMLLKGIQANRSNRSARAEVREAIWRARQLRGVLEARKA
jgi:hypothetical protein